jgi:hypothetical protein
MMAILLATLLVLVLLVAVDLIWLYRRETRRRRLMRKFKVVSRSYGPKSGGAA